MPEEDISDYDLQIHKSEIIVKPPPEIDVDFEAPPLLQIDKETEYEFYKDDPSPLEVPVELEGERVSSLLYIEGGGHNTLKTRFSLTGRGSISSYILDAQQFYTGGYREGSGSSNLSLFFSSLDEESGNVFAIGASAGEVFMPGPVANPSGEKRKQFTFDIEAHARLTGSILLSSGIDFYNIGVNESLFSDIRLTFYGETFRHETDLALQNFIDNYSLYTIAHGIFWQGPDMEAGLRLKKADGDSPKLLPYVDAALNPYLSFRVDSVYRIPDLWGEVLSVDYKGMISEKPDLEESYRIGFFMDRDFEQGRLQLNVMHAFRQHHFTWADLHNTGLLNPQSQSFDETLLGVDIEADINENFSWFFNAERSFFNGDVDYLPRESFACGLDAGFSNLGLRGWFDYTGERRFGNMALEGFGTLNSEITVSWEDKLDWGAGVTNLLNNEFEYAPGYPAEPRRFYSFLRLYF